MEQYRKYINLVKSGEGRLVAERLSTLPNKDFAKVYETVTGKQILDPDKRLRNVTEIVDKFAAVV